MQPQSSRTSSYQTLVRTKHQNQRQSAKQPLGVKTRSWAGKAQCASSETRKNWLRADRITAGTNCFHCFTAAPGIYLLQNTMNVVSYRKLRQIQAGSDFLVCKTLGDQGNQLLLTQSEFRSGSRALGRHFSGHLNDEAE